MNSGMPRRSIILTSAEFFQILPDSCRVIGQNLENLNAHEYMNEYWGRCPMWDSGLIVL